MHRFYCLEGNYSSDQIAITNKEELHHLRNVLRLKKEAHINLFNGKGMEASGILLAVSSQKAEVQITSVKESKQKKPEFILACALPKKSKFEFIIEKATELGVDEIVPLKTQRTGMNLKGDRLITKMSRFQMIAINAAKQSQRNFIPIIHPIMDFSPAIKHLSKISAMIIPSLMGERRKIFDVFRDLKSPNAIAFLIGPEGDFTPEEYCQAHKSGCVPVTLGDTVLKVETAAICALSCANLFFRS
ncbi:MAG: 16S rRNA (uracil(1498)-N(3))-methyltransferase [Candidatus Omnitrophica bacterium]|nr:16S rRNA (uracil(1498)-N(3))-methyltransferase [Candidatus Omnitrophota bacterium]